MLLFAEVPEGAIVCDEQGRINTITATTLADISPLEKPNIVFTTAKVVRVLLKGRVLLNGEVEVEQCDVPIEQQVAVFKNARVAYVFDGGYCADNNTWYRRGNPRRAELPPSDTGWTYSQVMAALQH